MAKKKPKTNTSLEVKGLFFGRNSEYPPLLRRTLRRMRKEPDVTQNQVKALDIVDNSDELCSSVLSDIQAVYHFENDGSLNILDAQKKPRTAAFLRFLWQNRQTIMAFVIKYAGLLSML
jgi:hypothetical protein